MMYVLCHKRELNDEKIIGVFQKENVANDIMDEYKKKEGFRDYTDGFEIIEVPFHDNIFLDKGTTVFAIVSYIWDENEDEVDIRYHRIFKEYNIANQYLDEINRIQGRVYEIQEVFVDVAYWVDGYVTIYYE